MEERVKGLWSVRERQSELVRGLVEETGLRPVMAQLLINRGFLTAEQVRDFLDCSRESFDRLNLIPGIAHAADVVVGAVERGEKVMVFGDYDADGVTATAVMVKILRAIGAETGFHIPDRMEEGYDLNEETVVEAAAEGYRLILTVDCGIRAVGSADAARKRGIKVVVTDHHDPGEKIPEADAVVNPKLSPDASLHTLAGVGVAFALARILASRYDGVTSGTDLDEDGMLELAALGTIADAVPLTGVSRVIARHGLEVLPRTCSPGLSALLQANGLEEKAEITETDVGFKLAPCINACGRVGNAEDALRLLLTDAPGEAMELALRMHRDNSKRQSMESQVVNEAAAMVDADISPADKVIVLASEDWHPGIIGIAASRIADRFQKPAFLVSTAAGTGRGSARSWGDFDINEALEFCGDLLIRYGGHKGAGGFSVAWENLPQLRQRLNSFASSREIVLSQPCLEIDCEVLLGELDRELIREMSLLRPFGAGSPPPRFLYRNARIKSCRPVGKSQEHLKLSVAGESLELDAIAFRKADRMDGLDAGGRVDLVFCPELNRWNGHEEIQLVVEDFGPSLIGVRQFEKPAEGIGGALTAAAQQLGAGERCLCVGGAADAAVAELAANRTGKQALSVFLFPTQSMVFDFEKSLKACCGEARVAALDFSLRDSEIAAVLGLVTNGAVDVVAATYGQWASLEDLRKTTAQTELLCVHLGYWNDGFPGLDGLVERARAAVEGWSGPIAFFGTGGRLAREATGRLGISRVVEEESLPRPVIKACGRLSVQGVCALCSGDKRGTLIYVNSAKEALGLAGAIRALAVFEPYEVQCYHGGLAPTQKTLALDQFNHGTARVLVASRGLEQYLVRAVERVVFCSCPLNIGDFARFLLAEEVFLAFNAPDVRRTREYIGRVCPEAEAYEKVYREVLEKGKERLYREICSDTNGQAAIGPERRALRAAFAVIEELGLPETGGKTAIEAVLLSRSWRYMDACLEFAGHDDLVSFLAEGNREAAADLTD